MIAFLVIFILCVLMLASIIRQVYKNEKYLFPKFRENLKGGETVYIANQVRGIYLTPDPDDPEWVILSVRKNAIYPPGNYKG